MPMKTLPPDLLEEQVNDILAQLTTTKKEVDDTTIAIAVDVLNAKPLAPGIKFCDPAWFRGDPVDFEWDGIPDT